MKYLLDTHIILWYFTGSKELSKAAKSIIEDADTQKYVSIASFWEFAIKYSKGKLQFDGGLACLWEMVSQNGFIILPIEKSHLTDIIQLPFLHRDPFDRLLVATAQADDMTILTADENIHKYDVSSVW